jgi:O-acetylserine/cysteine efflux transporter
MLVSAAFLAVGTVLMKGLRGLDVFSQQGWTAVFSVLPLLAISASVEPGAMAQLPQVSWVAWAGAATPRSFRRCSATASTTCWCSGIRWRR